MRHEKSNLIFIGFVSFVPKGTLNPYRAKCASGEERRNAIFEFHDRGECELWEAWHVPAPGGARKISYMDINWPSAGLEPIVGQV